jgi:hypothetical protein
MRTVRKPPLSEKETMRIDRKKLTLIIASLCGAGSSAITMGQEYSNSSPISSVGRIGDGGVAASKMSNAGIPQVPDSRPTAFRSNVVDESVPNSVPTNTRGSFYDPAVPAGRPVFTQNDYDTASSYVDNSCSSCSTGSSCSSGCSQSCSSASTGWFESESLLWFGKSLTGAPVIVGSNTTTDAQPRNVLTGGNNNPIGTNLLYGMRIDTGLWLDDCQNLGVGGRVWGILTDGTTSTYNNGGNSTGIPFFNTVLGANDIYLININAGALGANTGTISVRNDLNLVAGELYTRMLLAREGKSRSDLLTGYTFARLDSTYGLNTSFTDGITNLIQNGTAITTSDTFGTKNTFHGGHIGFLNEVNRGRFTFSLLSKVSLGGMHSESTVRGQSSTTPPNGVATVQNRGLFAQSSNAGVITQNRFTFLPEAGAKMRYQLGRAQFGVGYTMMLFPSVAMAASQVDRNIDLAGVPPVAPLPKFTNETFFLHGLDLGLTFRF